MAKYIYYIVLQWESYPYDGDGFQGQTEADGPYYNKKEAMAELKQSLRNQSSGDKEHTYYGFLYVGNFDDDGNIDDYDMEDPEISARNGRILK